MVQLHFTLLLAADLPYTDTASARSMTTHSCSSYPSIIPLRRCHCSTVATNVQCTNGGNSNS